MSATARNIVLVDLRYPYGKSKVFMNGSLCNAAAVLTAAGHKVKIIDFNLDTFEGARDAFEKADLVGVSLIGGPYIPESIGLIKRLKDLFPALPVMLGGQVIERLSDTEFATIYGTTAIQIRTKSDLAEVLSRDPAIFPDWFQVSLIPVWEGMGDARLKQYLESEFTLVVSQGCIFRCLYCAARKGEKEQHGDISVFEQDMKFLANKAASFDIQELSCYASSLDFFQNPLVVKDHLEILAKVSRKTGVKFRVRCLSCVSSFVRAERMVPDLQVILQEAGLYCIGFGVDGTKEIWAAQNKKHNDEDDVPLCLALCHKMGLRTEILIVMGYPQDNLRTLLKLLANTFRYILTWPKTVDIRPYLDKETVPGNAGWKTGNGRVRAILAKPSLFYNLDFAACASKLTDPVRSHRWMVNFFYLMILALYKLIGRCPNNPLFPQGTGGLGSKIARLANRLMPFDR